LISPRTGSQPGAANDTTPGCPGVACSFALLVFRLLGLLAYFLVEAFPEALVLARLGSAVAAGGVAALFAGALALPAFLIVALGVGVNLVVIRVVAVARLVLALRAACGLVAALLLTFTGLLSCFRLTSRFALS